MTAKFLKFGAVLAAGALALAACSSGDSGSGSTTAATGGDTASDRGPITFAMGKNDTDKLTPIIEAWNAEHPDEQVTLHELAGEADAQRDTLVQSLQAGSGDYDVMALDVIWTAQFAANGWLSPIQDDLAVDTSGLLDSTVESATYNGTLYAVPQNTNGQLLFYRTDITDSAPTTIDQVKEICDSETRPRETDCFLTQLKQYEGLTVNTSDFIHAWGGTVVDADGTTPTVESDESKAGLQALVDLYTDGYIPQNALAATEEETNQAFVGGEVAFAINWPYMYDNAANSDSSEVAETFAVAPIPGHEGVGASTLGGYNNGINVNSEYKATARDFVEFIINEENQTSFAEASFPPVLAAIYDDAGLIEQYPYLPALKDSLENAKPRPVTPFYTAISKAIQDNAYAALRGEKSVDAAVADMAAAITAAG